MSDLAALLLNLGAAGVTLRADGNSVLHKPGVLPPGWTDGLAQHLTVIVAVLTDWQPDGEDEHYQFEERLGIASGQGMLTDAGTPAWLMAVGEVLASRGSRNLDPHALPTGHVGSLITHGRDRS